MPNSILNVLSIGLKPLYDKHWRYYKIIKEFRDQLPRSQHEARKLSEDEKKWNPVLSSLQNLTVVDMSTHQMSINEADLDTFYNRLNNFDYSFMLFKTYYKKYTRNLNRFNPKAENRNFDLFMVQQVLKDSPLKPLKPIDVLFYHLKWEITFTSRIYIWFIKRKKKKAHL